MSSSLVLRVTALAFCKEGGCCPDVNFCVEKERVAERVDCALGQNRPYRCEIRVKYVVDTRHSLDTGKEEGGG